MNQILFILLELINCVVEINDLTFFVFVISVFVYVNDGCRFGFLSFFLPLEFVSVAIPTRSFLP